MKSKRGKSEETYKETQKQKGKKRQKEGNE
jgi:hypothetical protein